MKKIQIVQGIMAVVGKMSKMIGNLVKGITKQITAEDVDMKAEVHKEMGNLRLKQAVGTVVNNQQFNTVEINDGKKEDRAQEQGKVLNIEELRKQKEQLAEEQRIQPEEVQEKEEDSTCGMKQDSLGGAHKVKLVRKVNHKVCYKNKGLKFPLHRLEATDHQVIYLHQRAPTYMIQRRQHGRKRGTGT